MLIREVAEQESLLNMKRAYVQQATAPLDGMWLCGFVPKEKHFGFFDGDELLGYCCVDDQAYLLQFHVSPNLQNRASTLFDSVFEDDSSAGKILGAFVLTAEPCFLSHCLDRFSNFEVNAIMYQLDESYSNQTTNHKSSIEPIGNPQLEQAVEFAVAAIGIGRLAAYVLFESYSTR